MLQHNTGAGDRGACHHDSAGSRGAGRLRAISGWGYLGPGRLVSSRVRTRADTSAKSSAV